MNNKEYAIAYKEVFEILKYIPKVEYNKIPKERIELYKTMQDKNYRFKYDPSKTFDEQNISKRAKAIIGLLYRDFWATNNQREKIMAKQKYERQKIEEEKLQKYKNQELFKNNKIDIKDNQDSSFLIIYKENIFVKLLNKIKKLFE